MSEQHPLRRDTAQESGAAEPGVSHSQAIRAVRRRDVDGQQYWFCAKTGLRVEERSGTRWRYRVGNGVAARIIAVRDYDAFG